MNRSSLDSRLRELSIYSDFYYRKELKLLMQLIGEDEQLNCILTGVHEGNRKMVAVTDRRILVLFAGTLGAGDVKVIRRDSVKDYSFEKKFPFSSMRFETLGGTIFTFTNTQGRLKDLFLWAMEQPIPDPD